MVPLSGYREYLCSPSGAHLQYPVKITRTQENFFKRYTIFIKKKYVLKNFSETPAQFQLKFFTLHQLSSSSIDQSFFLISALFHWEIVAVTAFVVVAVLLLT